MSNRGPDHIGGLQLRGRERLSNGHAAHRGSLGRLDPVDGIFHHHALRRDKSKLASGGEENIGGGLLADNIFGADQASQEAGGKPA